jgi:hypothetical protein
MLDVRGLKGADGTTTGAGKGWCHISTGMSTLFEYKNIHIIKYKNKSIILNNK